MKLTKDQKKWLELHDDYARCQKLSRRGFLENDQIILMNQLEQKLLKLEDKMRDEE